MRQQQQREPISRPGNQDVERWTGEGGSTDNAADMRRSDDRIRQAIADVFAEQGVDATRISVRVMGGDVSLTGNMPDAEQRRRAEELAQNVSGVREVSNNIQIATPTSAS